jgi:hypothetical protein
MSLLAHKALAALSWSPALSAAAVIALLFALGLVWYAYQDRRELRLMKSIKMSRAADVAALAPGTLVEVQGTLRCAAPLAGEFSGKPSAYFKAEIIKTETWYETDSDNKRSQKSRDTTLHSNVQYAPCHVEDDSGRVAIELKGAAIDETQVLLERIDGKAASIAGALIGVGRETTSTSRIEHNLAVDIPIYVLGEVQPGGGIGAPAAGSHNKIFVVSLKSEEERSRHLAEMSSFGLKIAAGLLAISVLLFGFAWYKAN